MTPPVRPSVDPSTLESSLKAQGATPAEIDEVFTQLYGPPIQSKWPKSPLQAAGLRPAPREALTATPERPTLGQLALGGGGGAESTAEYNPKRAITHGTELTGVPLQLSKLFESGVSALTHPIETATGIVTAAPKAAFRLGQYLGQPIAQAFEPESYAAQQRATGALAPVSGKEAAESAFQLAAMGLAGPAETALAQTPVGPTLAKVVTHGTVGATFMPQAPLAGALLGAGASLAAPALGMESLKQNAEEAARSQRLAGPNAPWDVDLRNVQTQRRTAAMQAEQAARQAQAAQTAAQEAAASERGGPPAPLAERAYPFGATVGKQPFRPLEIDEPSYSRRRPGGAATAQAVQVPEVIAPDKSDPFWRMAAPEREAEIKDLLSKLDEAIQGTAEASKKQPQPATAERFPEGYLAGPESLTRRRAGGAIPAPSVPSSLENTLDKLFRAAASRTSMSPKQLADVVETARTYQRLRGERQGTEPAEASPLSAEPTVRSAEAPAPVTTTEGVVSVGRDVNEPGRIPNGVKRAPTVEGKGEEPNGVMVGPDGTISYGAFDPKRFAKSAEATELGEGTASKGTGSAKHPPQRPGVFIPDEVHDIRDDKGFVRRDLSRVPNAALEAESNRLNELEAQAAQEEHRLYEQPLKGSREGYTSQDMDDLLQGRTRQEIQSGYSMEDAAGLFGSEDELKDFLKDRRTFARERLVRQARAKLQARIDSELARRAKLNYRVENKVSGGEGEVALGGEGETLPITEDELQSLPTLAEHLAVSEHPTEPPELLQMRAAEPSPSLLRSASVVAPPEPARTPKVVPADELINNVRKLNLQQPSEQAQLLADLQRLHSQGFTKEAQTVQAQIDAARPRIDTELAYMVSNYDPAMAARLTGAEAMALSERLNQNIAMRVALNKELATPGLEPEQRGELQTMIDKLQLDADALVKNISRATSQHGRDLAYSRQLAARSLDPAVWLVQAKRALGDAPLTDEIRSNIERLVNEAREACGE